jgi:hypothetical protein
MIGTTEALVMFSKSNALRIFLLAICLNAIVACSVPTNEDPPASPDIQTGMGSECLSSSMEAVKSFVGGTGEPEKLEGFFNCVGSTVADFEKNTRGRYEDRFTARELANFVERYFLADGDKLSDSLMTEVFRLKQLFVGGAIESISRDEMFKLIQVISDLKKITLSINPYMKLYTFGWKVGSLGDPQKEMKYFELANLQIQQSAKDLAALIEKNGRSYDIDNVVNFISEIENFAGESWDWIDGLREAMPLVHDLKKTLTGGSENIIEPKEWIRFSLISSRGFVQYLRFKYFILDRRGLDDSNATIIYLTRSVDDLFSFLGDMVESKPNKSLTREELLKITERIGSFIPGFKVSDVLLKEIMKIKVVFFGGGLDFFVKADFDKARTKLENFRELSTKFIDYLDVYTLQWKRGNLSLSESKKYFSVAEKALVDAAKQLGLNLENKYDLKDLKLLANEVDKLYPPKDPKEETLGSIANKFLPPLISFKNIFFSDEGSIVGTTRSGSQDWSDVLTFTAQIYGRFAYYKYFLAGQNLFEWPAIYTLNTFVDESVKVMDSLLSRKKSNLIAFWEIDELIQSLIGGGFIPKQFTKTSIKSLVRVLLQKFLVEPTDRLAGNVPQGFNKVSLKVFRSEYYRWFATQEWMEEFYRDVSGSVGKSGTAIVNALINTGPQTEENTEMILIYKSPQALSLDNSNRLYLSTRQPLHYNRNATHVMNLARTAIRLFQRGYAMDIDRIRTRRGVTLEEANNLFNDVRGFFVELGFLDPKDKDFANSRFRDANLFTPFSNGDSLLDFGEGTALVMMLYSGISIDGKLQTALKKQCNYYPSPTGFAGDQTVDVSCVAQVYKNEIMNQFVGMPELINYIAPMDPAAFAVLFENLLKAAGYVPNDEGRIKLGFLSLFPQVTQYVESVFLRADKDLDGFLWTGEAVDVYPVFKNIITDFSGLSSEKQNKAVFTYMLKHGKPPESLSEKAGFILLWVPKGEKGWNIWADRLQVVKILGYIADAMAKQITINLEGADNPALLESPKQ